MKPIIANLTREAADVLSRRILQDTPLLTMPVEAVDAKVRRGFADYMRLQAAVRHRNNPAYRYGQKLAHDRLVRNPFGYYCAPNQATPDYVAAQSIRDFIGYGLMGCHYDLQFCDGFTPDNEDYYWFRRSFLSAVDRMVYLYPQAEKGERVDDDNHDDDFLFMSDEDRAARESGSEEDPENELMFRWRFDLKDSEGSVCLTMDWHPLSGDGPGDSESIWADSSLFKGHWRRQWIATLRHATRINDWLHAHPFS